MSEIGPNCRKFDKHGLEMNDFQPASVLNAEGSAPFVLICEHASNFIPPEYNNLGLEPSQLKRHIAYDPGALEVAKGIAMRLNAPLVHANISRLVIDLNRKPDDIDAIPEIGELTPVPGNQAISAQERARRAQAYYFPFHKSVSDVIGAQSNVKALISMHSFTPVFKGTARPWHVGIIHSEDAWLSSKMMAQLTQDHNIVGGLNVPYSPSDRVFHTLGRHSSDNRHGVSLQTAMIEVRNDLISEPNGQDLWAGRLAQAIEAGLDL